MLPFLQSTHAVLIPSYYICYLGCMTIGSQSLFHAYFIVLNTPLTLHFPFLTSSLHLLLQPLCPQRPHLYFHFGCILRSPPLSQCMSCPSAWLPHDMSNKQSNRSEDTIKGTHTCQSSTGQRDFCWGIFPSDQVLPQNGALDHSSRER